jgi:hypothetical protein
MKKKDDESKLLQNKIEDLHGLLHQRDSFIETLGFSLRA